MSSRPIALERFEQAGTAIIHEARSLEFEKSARQEAERLAAEDSAQREQLSKIKIGLETLCQQTRMTKDQAVECLATAIGDSAGILFTALMSDGFSHEVAAATSDLISSGNLVRASLHVAAEDHDRIIAILSEINPPHEVAVVSDDSMEPGTAKLHWDQGGANFDAAALVLAARARFAAQLKPCETRSDEDE